MSTLSTLIKLAQQQLDGLQVQLTALRTQVSALQTQREELQNQINRGFIAAADTPGGLQDMEPFLKRTRQEDAHLASQQQALEQDMTEVDAAIRAAFAQKKRYEILQERQAAQAKAHRQKQAQAELEDLAQRNTPHGTPPTTS